MDSTVFNTFRASSAFRVFILLISVDLIFSEDWGSDNWGAPSIPVKKWGGAKLPEITATCQWESGKFSKTMSSATLNYFPTTKSWSEMKGFDRVPENHYLFDMKKFHKLNTTAYPSTILGGRCKTTPAKDGSRWTFERIGPIISTGGYDWWQFGWDNVFQSSQMLKEFPDGIYILNHFSGPVDKDGNILPFPNIHIHHVHVSPGNVNPWRMNVKNCLLSADSKYCSSSGYVVFEQHGDYQCREKDGGVNCLLEDLPEGYAKHLIEPLTINGELNDVRAANSEPIEWYYQTAIRWVPKVESEKLHQHYKPLSFHYFWSPGRLDITDQSTMVNTFKAPTDKDTMIWYSGKMNRDGKLIRAKMHTHNTVFKNSLFFSATPEQLGMVGARFIPKDKAYDTIPLSDMGFQSIEQATHYILDAYHKNLNNVNSFGLTPRLICYGETDNEEVVFPTGTFKFDRRAPMWCDEWSFKEGEYFVVVGFNQHAGGPPGPHMPDVIPSWLPGHLHWFLLFDSPDKKSHYEYGYYTQDPEHYFIGSAPYAHIPYGGFLNTYAMVINKGIPTASQMRFILLVTAALILLVLSVGGFVTFFAFKAAREAFKNFLGKKI